MPDMRIGINMNERLVENTNLYIKIEQDILTYNKKVFVRDLGTIFCTNYDVKKQIGDICILNIKDSKDNKYMFSIMKVIEQIHRQFPGINVISLGEDEFIIDYRLPQKKSKWKETFKIAIVSLIIFFGAAFSIMTFNEDVSVKDVFELVYRVFGAENGAKFKVVEIAYSVGIALGIIAFFNHFSKYKDENDPTPLQIELRKYEEDTNNALLADASRKGKMHDI